MQVPLEKVEDQIRFLDTCAEFLEYIAGDCMGLSPGPDFFEQSADGLGRLAESMPRFAPLFREAKAIYDVLLAQAPGQMYPKGSQMFSDIGHVETTLTGLRDAAESLGE